MRIFAGVDRPSEPVICRLLTLIKFYYIDPFHDMINHLLTTGLAGRTITNDVHVDIHNNLKIITCHRPANGMILISMASGYKLLEPFRIGSAPAFSKNTL